MGERRGQGRELWRSLWPLAALCLITSSRWLIDGAVPGSGSTVLSQTVGCLLASGLFGLVAILGQSRSPLRRWGPGWTTTLLGVGLIVAGPALAQEVAGRSINANNATLALALTATVVGLMTSSLGETASANLAGLLWPGLAGVMGLLLMLPQPAYGTWRPWVGLLSMPLLAGSGAFLLSPIRAEDQGTGGGDSVALALGLAACSVVLAGLALTGGRPSLGAGLCSACGLDGLAAALTLLSLRRLGAVRWCAQFAIIPLLAMIEGIVFVRPILDLRSWAGLGFIAVGAAYQLFLTGHATESVASYQVTPRVPES